MKINLFYLSLILIGCLNGVFGQYASQPYSPLTSREVTNTFPVKYVWTVNPSFFEKIEGKSVSKSLTAGVSDISISENNGELQIHGKDKGSEGWSVKLGDNNIYHSARFYVSDLDRNGIDDLIILTPTGGNGWAPQSHLCTLTFDRLGRPVPFCADGYFEDLNNKIPDLVDLDGDGRAELIYANFDDGYWITTPYKIGNARWQKVTGKIGSRSYPLYVRFTNRENHKATPPAKNRHPYSPDLSNISPRIFEKLVSFEWANVTQSEDITLELLNKNERIPAKPVSWYSTFFIVIDKSNGREIVSLSASNESVKAALNDIIKYGNKVEISQRNRNSFSPELLWTTVSRNK